MRITAFIVFLLYLESVTAQDFAIYHFRVNALANVMFKFIPRIGCAIPVVLLPSASLSLCYHVTFDIYI